MRDTVVCYKCGVRSPRAETLLHYQPNGHSVRYHPKCAPPKQNLSLSPVLTEAELKKALKEINSGPWPL